MSLRFCLEELLRLFDTLFQVILEEIRDFLLNSEELVVLGLQDEPDYCVDEVVEQHELPLFIQISPLFTQLLKLFVIGEIQQQLLLLALQVIGELGQRRIEEVRGPGLPSVEKHLIETEGGGVVELPVEPFLQFQEPFEVLFEVELLVEDIPLVFEEEHAKSLGVQKRTFVVKTLSQVPEVPEVDAEAVPGGLHLNVPFPQLLKTALHNIRISNEQNVEVFP